MTLGFDRSLYILPFDNRGAFEKRMFGWNGILTIAKETVIEATKRIIYDGFKAAIAAGLPKGRAGILACEEFGAEILREAAAEGFTFACPADKCGQQEFDFEYGDDFAAHIEAFQPTFCKVLVRYNPKGDRALNSRQTERLERLSDYLHSKSRSLLLLWESLHRWRQHTITREIAVEEIAGRYREFVDVFEKARGDHAIGIRVPYKRVN